MNITLLKDLTIEDELLTIEQIASMATRVSQLDMLSKVYIALNYVAYDLSKFNDEAGVNMVKLYEFVDKNLWKSIVRKLGRKKVAYIKGLAKERYMEINNPINKLVLSPEDLDILQKMGDVNAKKDN